MPKQELKAGDKVKYSENWLRSCGMYNALKNARAEVVEIVQHGSLILATLKWQNNMSLPDSVNVSNLKKVGK
jgi:hypothetical protein